MSATLVRIGQVRTLDCTGGRMCKRPKRRRDDGRGREPTAIAGRRRRVRPLEESTDEGSIRWRGDCVPRNVLDHEVGPAAHRPTFLRPPHPSEAAATSKQPLHKLGGWRGPTDHGTVSQRRNAGPTGPRAGLRTRR
eukprot:7391825-Prymnesium_polylepis.4